MAKKKSTKIHNEAQKWYIEKRPFYQQLSDTISHLLTELVKDENIPYHAIYARTKEIDSFCKKIEDPKYTDPKNQITDLTGLRIITYVESDLDKLCKLVENHFAVDKDNSIDKTESLGVDKVGYRSIHYIAQLPSDRTKFPEYKKFANIKFEIQIRTILQHAWAEIEHDKNYKFAGELPSHLTRRFMVLSGVLELADREFNEIAKEIDKYSFEVKNQAEKGNLDISIDATSITSYLKFKFKKLIKAGKVDFSDGIEDKVLEELKNLGITNLREFDDIVPKNITETILHHNFTVRARQIIRCVLIVNNPDEYFLKHKFSWWGNINMQNLELLKYYQPNIEKYLNKHNIEILE